MSTPPVNNGGPPKDLRLVKPDGLVDPQALDQVTDALRTAVTPAHLDAADHEALLAMTLGDEVSAIDEAEWREAEVLRAALEGGGSHALADLARGLAALAAADRPSAALADADHEVLVALTLGDACVREEPLRAERVAAEELRAALAGEEQHPLAELAQTLRATAGRARPIDQLSHERILRRVLRAASSARRVGPATALAAIVALAASVALFVGSFGWLETGGDPAASHPPAAPPVAAAKLIVARSTQELFDPLIPFPRTGGESERLARIVTARASDLRANRFAAWGVR